MDALLQRSRPAPRAGADDHHRHPDRHSLLGVSIRNGVATVDLSTEFDSGGGTASMEYRLAQVVYTLTQYSTVRSVVFQVEGQTVTVFGSEGIVLDGPVGRADYAISCRRSSSTGPPTVRRCRTRAKSAATPTFSRRRSGPRSWMRRAPPSSTSR